MKRKILIVDDEPEIREVLTRRLEAEGYSIDTAKGGKEAIGAFVYSLYNGGYDLVVLDIMLPEIDGISILDIIRKEEELRGIRIGEGVSVIMLTALRDSWMESFKNGCDDYLTKPYLPQQLLNKIEDTLKSRIAD